LESKLGEGSFNKAMVAAELSKIGDKNIALELVSTDLNQVDDLELLTKFAQFESQTARKNRDAATRSALRSAGIQVGKEDDLKEVLANLDDDDKISIEAKAKEKRIIVKSAIDNVQIPEYIDPITKLNKDFEQRKTRTAELEGKWGEAMTSLESSFDKLTFKDTDFEFQIPEEEKSILKDFIRVASKQEIVPNEANKLMILQKAKQAIRDNNFDKIMQGRDAYNAAKIKKELDAAHHNLSPLETDKVIIVDNESSEAQSKFRKQMGLK